MSYDWFSRSSVECDVIQKSHQRIQQKASKHFKPILLGVELEGFLLFGKHLSLDSKFLDGKKPSEGELERFALRNGYHPVFLAEKNISGNVQIQNLFRRKFVDLYEKKHGAQKIKVLIVFVISAIMPLPPLRPQPTFRWM